MSSLKQQVQRLEALLRQGGVKSIEYRYNRAQEEYWTNAVVVDEVTSGVTKDPNTLVRKFRDSAVGGETTIICKDDTEVGSTLSVQCRSNETFVKDKGRLYALAAMCKLMGIKAKGTGTKRK